MLDINRCLVIVRPKQPFLDWLNSVEGDEFTLEDISHDPTSYLVPEYEFNAEQASILDWGYDLMFESELSLWYTEPSLWPPDRPGHVSSLV